MHLLNFVSFFFNPLFPLHMSTPSHSLDTPFHSPVLLHHILLTYSSHASTLLSPRRRSTHWQQESTFHQQQPANSPQYLHRFLCPPFSIPYFLCHSFFFLLLALTPLERRCYGDEWHCSASLPYSHLFSLQLRQWISLEFFHPWEGLAFLYTRN